MKKVDLCPDCQIKGHCQYIMIMNQVAFAGAGGTSPEAEKKTIEEIFLDIRLEANNCNCPLVRKNDGK